MSSSISHASDHPQRRTEAAPVRATRVRRRPIVAALAFGAIALVVAVGGAGAGSVARDGAAPTLTQATPPSPNPSTTPPAPPAAAPATRTPAPPASAPAPAPSNASIGQAFKVDTGHSGAVFRIKHMDVAFFWGRFDTITGTVTPDAESPSFDVTIDANSVNTGSKGRDDHLRSPDFFNVKEFPSITFKSTSSKRMFMQPQRGMFYEVDGELTMHGVTKPVKAMVEWTGTADTPRGRRCGFEAMFTVKRSDFGMNYGLDQKALGDEVRLFVGIEGVVAP